MPSKLIHNSRVLVTGGAGFIGSNLVEALLQQDNEVICLDNLLTGKRKNIEPFLGQPGFIFIEGDIREPDMCKKAVKGVDYVLHQAALGSVPRSIKDPATSTGVNIDGFVNMLVAAKDEGVKRFVYASSSSVYGDHPDLPKHEDKIGTPLSPYAITKYTNEVFAKNFASLYGIECIGLRYFNVFGKRQDPEGPYAAAIPRFIRAIMKYESPKIFGDGEQSRDFTFIDNVLKMNQLAATATSPEAVNQVYNVACGERTTVNKMVSDLIEMLSAFDSRVANVKPAYTDPRPGDILHSLASIDKANTLLGYTPDYLFSEGLQKAIKWYWENL